MDREEHLAKRIAELDEEEIVSLHNEIASETNDLEYVEENGEDFSQTFYYNRLDEMARAIHYGKYNYTEKYIRINTYGNIETTDYPLTDGWVNVEDIAHWLRKNAESETFCDIAEGLIEQYYLEDDLDDID